MALNDRKAKRRARRELRATEREFGYDTLPEWFARLRCRLTGHSGEWEIRKDEDDTGDWHNCIYWFCSRCPAEGGLLCMDCGSRPGY